MISYRYKLSFCLAFQRLKRRNGMADLFIEIIAGIAEAFIDFLLEDVVSKIQRKK